MLNARRILHLTTLISAFFTCLPAGALDLSNPQFSLSLDGLGQNIYFPIKKNQIAAGTGAVGGMAFADFRPIRLISLGVGFEYLYFPDNTGLNLSSFDLGGRIFPYSFDFGEFYLQGGIGKNINNNIPTHGHYHGYASAGYRVYLSKEMALDAAAQYDYYSPYAYSSNSFGAKLGITFLFGRDRWPVPHGEQVDPSNIVETDYPSGSLYTWKAGDSLRSIAVKLLGNANLYPALVDANPEIFSDYRKIKVGIQIKVPDMSNFTDDQLSDLDYKGKNSDKYLQLADNSERIPYAIDKNWHGPHTYKWKSGDDMKSVAAKLYDDEDLYPILVDANKKRLVHPANLVPGTVLLVPAPPNDDWVDVIHQRSWQKSYDMWWKNVTQDQ